MLSPLRRPEQDTDLAPPRARPAPVPLIDDMLRDEHFRKLSAHVEAKIGIRLPPSKKAMVEGRLRPRARALGLTSLEAYGRHLFANGGLDAEFDQIVDCVTTNKTDFFREPEHVDILVKRLVPTLLSQGRDRARMGIKLWSAAASSGAEAYTLAMVMTELQATLPCEFSILGTDIGSEILQDARRAVYPISMLEGIPAHFQKLYTMQPRDKDRQEFQIIPELRRLLRLQLLNLVTKSYDVERDFDVIFCRNVLIYFERDVQQAVVGRLASHLRPGGYLLLGHSEAMAGNDQPGLRQIAPTVFQVRETGA